MKNLSVVYVKFERINCELNSDFVPNNDQPINLKHKLSNNLAKIDKDNAVICLLYSIPKDKEIPFSMEIQLCGQFHMEDWESDDLSKQVMTQNTCAILYPYLRAAVSNITTQMGIATLTLPVINVYKTLFGNK